MESCLKPQHTLHVSLSSLNNTISKLISLISSCFHIPIDYFLTKLPIAPLMHKIPSRYSVPKLLMPSHYTLNKIQSHYQHPHGPEYLIWCLLKKKSFQSSPSQSFSTPAIPDFFNSSNKTSMFLLEPKPKCYISSFCHLLSGQCIHWQNFTRAKLLRKSRKYLQPSSFSSTEKRINEQVWS